MVSDRLGARTIKRDLPPILREIGKPTKFAYSCEYVSNVKLSAERQSLTKMIGVPCCLAFSPQSGLQLMESP